MIEDFLETAFKDQMKMERVFLANVVNQSTERRCDRLNTLIKAEDWRRLQKENTLDKTQQIQ